MAEHLPIFKGRGAASNPPNRFERLRVDDDFAHMEGDEEFAAGLGNVQTEYYLDSSKSIITRNDSPDVGFTHSINPYRGCSHGCVYCLSGETPILMGDGTSKPIEDLAVGDVVYGVMRVGSYLRYIRTTVSAHWHTLKPAYRVTLSDGTTLVASGDHRFLSNRGWKYVTNGEVQRPHLTPNNELLGVGAFSPPPVRDRDYKCGYLCGIIRGDGHLGTYSYHSRARRDDQSHFRLAMADGEALERAARYLRENGVDTYDFVFQAASSARREMRAIRTNSRDRVRRVESLILWPSSPSETWDKGFLAGIFDAEGSRSTGVMRISNTDSSIIGHISRSLERLNFRFVLELVKPGGRKPVTVVRIRGGFREHLRFFHAVDPAITRKREIEGWAVKGDSHLRVVSVDPLVSEQPMFDITTGTGNFIANGVISHNCYARPTHEWLGFSPGLDFESKIMVKQDAPDLLRKELSSLKYTPVCLSISGVTDCYQPVERKLELTRRCLQVCAEFRNPVGVITKNHLVTRDLDLLAALAKHNAAVAILSITTLDADLARRMEPRTSSPRRRLEAVRALAGAGVSVGVMVAPVVPGLTDHEVPAILKAAAEAGARFAGSVPVRLPYAVKDLFADWLGRHFPDRKDKVLNRIRELRGGKLNDSNFGSRMRGEGVWAEQLKTMFELGKKAAGITGPFPEVSSAAFRRPLRSGQQMTLW